MSKRVNPLSLPDFSRHVFELLQQKNISLPLLAKRLNYVPDTVYKLFKNPNWKVNNIKAVSDVLGINLFAFYTKDIDAQWQQQVDNLHQSLQAKQAQINSLEQEKLLLKTENNLMRDMLGAKKG